MSNLKQWFKNLPIERKVNAAILLTCVIALISSGGAIFLAQLITFRQNFTRDLQTIAVIIANNSTAAISFRDHKTAEEILSALRVKAHILRATIELPDRSNFVTFQGAAEEACANAPRGDGFHSEGRYLFLNQPVLLANERIGTLRIVSNYQAEYRRSVSLYGAILAAVLGGSVLLALVLSRRLQRIISGPILKLAQAAQVVAERKDYSLRAPVTARDEVGQLTEAFNQMLQQIQSHAAALHQANLNLETEVEERKQTQVALEESRQRYEVAVLGSSDGLWDWDLAQQRFYFSARWKSMIGYADEELVNNYETWESRLHPDDRERVLRSKQEYLDGQCGSFEIEYRFSHKSGEFLWVLSRGAVLRDPAGKPVRFAGSHTDITVRRHAEQEVEKLNRQLVAASRQAGMAEVATGVLHNVGNVLNSVNVSTTLIRDRLRTSEIPTLARVSKMLQQRAGDLGTFLTTDPKGKLVPGFIQELSVQLEKEQSSLRQEHDQLVKNIEHIKEIVAMQQNYARVSGLLEKISLNQLVDDALRMNAAGFTRHGVQVVRDYTTVPLILADKHKVLQILVNLVHNAKYALDDCGRPDKLLTVHISLNGDNRVKVAVADNGVGIKPENLTRIFSHGFTTRKNGHGFGLHSGANAAKEMGGCLRAESEGPGKGATFILELPLDPEKP